MSYLSTVQGLSPTNFWRLGESAGTNAVDAQAANDITYSATGVTYSVAALISDSNTCVTMDGANGIITGYSLTNPSVQSVVAWYKGSTATEQAVWSRRFNGVAGEQIWGKSNTNKIFGYQGGDAGSPYTGTTNIGDGTRHMLTWVLNGSSLKMYVDGSGTPEVNATLDAGWTPGSAGSHPFTISFDTITGGRWVNGTIDEVAFWNGTAITATNVQDLWTAGTTAAFSGFTNTVPPSLSGALNVGGTLTINPGTWTPTPGSYSYYWHRADDAAGANLVEIGATGATYTMDAGDTGKYLRAGVIPSQ